MRAETPILILAALLLPIIAFLRPPEYDEAYSLFLTAGHARPAWPATPFHPAAIRSLYFGPATFPQIANDLRYGDVHPPLYFWLLKIWRDMLGPAWFTARLLSVIFALATLAILAHLARLLKAPPALTLLICLLTYGFAYTSIVARGFALAQLLLLAGVTLIFRHCERREAIHLPRSPALIITPVLAGLCLGAATFTNYLTIFTALTALTTLTLKTPRQSLFAILPFAAFLPADFWFFAIQHSTRAHQFAPFSLPHALTLLAKDSAAAWFGGLPLYAGHLAIPVAAALALLAAATLTLIAPPPPPHPPPPPCRRARRPHQRHSFRPARPRLHLPQHPDRNPLPRFRPALSRPSHRRRNAPPLASPALENPARRHHRPRYLPPHRPTPTRRRPRSRHPLHAHHTDPRPLRQ